jgi:ATP-dependent Clp protease protease subunit
MASMRPATRWLAGGCCCAVAVAAAAPHAHAKDAKSPNDLFYGHLLKKRQIFLSGHIDDASAKAVVAKLLYLESKAPGQPINLLITSGGGSVHAGLAVYDIMQYISSPVHTICVGHCESMAAILLAGGAKDKRTALPNARVMIHQNSLSVGSRKHAKDIIIRGIESEHTNQKLAKLLAHHTGRSTEEIMSSMEYDNYMTVEDAVQFGLVDSVQAALKPPAKAAVPATKEVPDKEASESADCAEKEEEDSASDE